MLRKRKTLLQFNKTRTTRSFHIHTRLKKRRHRTVASKRSNSIMASPSSWRWPKQNSSASLIGSSSFNASSISVYPFIFSHRQRSSFAFRRNHHPPPPPSCCSAGPNNAKRRPRKSDKQLQIGKISVHDDASVSKREQSLKTISNLNFKSLFGKRALWRRIFFASKKVRSIILLNVITLVYGKSEFLSQLLDHFSSLFLIYFDI